MWIAAAEPSGDALGARLVEVLRGRYPSVRVRGLAGPQLCAAGVESAADPTALTAFGLVEAAAKALPVLQAVRALARDIRSFEPDVVVTIDSPGLMLRLARRVDAPVLHWVAPQVWAWRAGRIPKIAASVDTLCCLLPFEPAWFEGHPVRAVFTGHPAAALAPTVPGPAIALIPGSRPQEVDRLWPILREVAAAIARRRPGARFTVAVAPNLDPRRLGGLAAELRSGVRAALDGAAAAVVCSGTATLEVAAAGVPQVVVYAVNPVTWAIGRRLVRGVDHVALPSLVAGREVIPEHLQHIDVEAVANDVLAAVEAPRGALDDLLRTLAPEGAVERVADEVERLRSLRSSRPGRSPTA